MSERGLSPIAGDSPHRGSYAGACERTYSM
jgi:hypothetical protein